MGQGGCGKSVCLNTQTAVTRRLFQYNNSILPGGVTGCSAFNIFGETLHRLTGQGISGEYQPFSMSETKKSRLLAKFRHLLCMVIDERSLLSSRLFGSTAQIISETIFDGSNLDDVLGGLPVLILAGDDYQLPGIMEGAFDVLSKVGGSKMTVKGRGLLSECSKKVYQLKTIRRMCDTNQADKDLVQRVRFGTDITDEDVEKLQSLHLDNIGLVHGPDIVKKIEDEAVYIFWTNEKRMKYNLIRLLEKNTPENPTAIIRPTGSGKKFGKGINSHFDSQSPAAALLCIGAKVCLSGYNFNPIWGLHNGACGTVKEIVFDTGHSPNKGDLPKYVVVEFPQYNGPTWDLDNPKVSSVK